MTEFQVCWSKTPNTRSCFSKFMSIFSSMCMLCCRLSDKEYKMNIVRLWREELLQVWAF